MNNLLKSCGIFLIPALITGLIPALADSPASEADRQAHWREDLKALSDGLKKQGYSVDLARGISTRGQKDFALLYPTFDAEIAAIDNDLPHLSDAEVYLRLTRLIASAHVGHNSIEIPAGMGFLNRLPLSFQWFADGLGVTEASSEYIAALGARVLSIGGMKPEQLTTEIAPYISRENDIQLRNAAPFFMTAAGMLRHFNLVGEDGTVHLELETLQGKSLTLKVGLADRRVARIGVTEGLHVPPLFFYSHARAKYWFEYLAPSHTLYVQYNVCANDPQLPFNEFAKQVLAAADANTVKRVVIDLRGNGGGDSRVINPLVHGLNLRVKSVGPFYVLIGPNTFSSAIDNAVTLRRELSAVLAGEPTGGMPDGYGEVKRLTLPNSKLVIRYSSKRWGPKGDDVPTTLRPDIAAPLKLADLIAGRDPVLDAVLKDSEPAQLSSRIAR
jgi:hypothetical protein